MNVLALTIFVTLALVCFFLYCHPISRLTRHMEKRLAV